MASSMAPNPQVNGVRSTWQEQLQGSHPLITLVYLFSPSPLSGWALYVMYYVLMLAKIIAGKRNFSPQSSLLFRIVEVTNNFLSLGLYPLALSVLSHPSSDVCQLASSLAAKSFPNSSHSFTKMSHRNLSNGEHPSYTEYIHSIERILLMSAFFPPFLQNAIGGRTAWSSRVNIQGQDFSARYWYDGQYLNNAKEDAAEVALMKLNSQTRSPTSHAGQLYAQQGNGQGSFP